MSFGRQSAHTIDSPNAVAVGHESPNAIPHPTEPITRLQSWATSTPERYIVPICGGFAGAVSGLVSCPLDVIKTKLQAQGGFQIPKNNVKLTTAAYRGVYGTAATIWTEEGVRGMYRGLGPMLLGYVPTWAVYLTVYNRTQAFFRTKTDNWFLANVYASLSGGACSTMATNPIWVIKTRLMAQSNSNTALKHSRPPWQYRNTLDAARKMYRAEGLLSFYSGLTPALLGLTHVAIQFPLYEVFKEKFTGIGAGMTETEEDRSHHFYGLALAVFLSKVCASTATYPHEVVRTRLQTQQRAPSDTFSNNFIPLRTNGDHGHPPASANMHKPVNGLPYRGTIQTCKTIFLEEGWRGFYAGLGTNLIRAVPSAMTTILTFEYLKKTMNHLRHEGQDRLELSGQPVA
ncbi:MAG: hypothetical protein L6R42_007335 [Xanthoria sp. 1 TBL-2021]|nr:MAG: hypothetical protein L6R42_007335 [Xanthoria sp. 1 TBL-2021]